jgi:hypothetical protein
LGKKPIAIIKNNTFKVHGKFGQIKIFSRLRNFCASLLVLKFLFFIQNMWFYAFLKGLTFRKHKNKKKFFFSLKYTTLINPYTNHKKTCFLKIIAKKNDQKRPT